MLNTKDTLWAITEVFGDRQEILNGISFIGLMCIGYVFLILIWG